MTNLRGLVTELAGIEEGPAVVTLYLDTHWRDEHQRDRVRLFFRDRLRDAKQLFGEDAGLWQSLSRTFEPLQDWIDLAVNQDAHPEARGAMLVASSDRELFRATLVGEPFEPAMFIDPQPRLYPLIEMSAAELPALLVSVDSSGAEILLWDLGEIVDEHEIERNVPNRHKRGGWSQRRYERHVRHVIQGVWRECSTLLAQVAAETPDADIVLFGQEANLRAFERLLPSAVAGRIVGMRPLQPERLEMLSQARAVLADERIAREFAIVHRILRQGLSDRSGSVGLQETLMAVNERRAKMLAMSRRFNPPGFRCTNCGALWLTGASGCVFCGGQTVSALLREELTRRCVLEGGELLVLPDGGPLDAYQGLGCLLRHLTSGERAQHPIGIVGPGEPALMP